MGHKSTVRISRKAAEEALRDELDVSELSDYQLEEILELVRGGYDHEHNYAIVPEGQEGENWEIHPW